MRVTPNQHKSYLLRRGKTKFSVTYYNHAELSPG